MTDRLFAITMKKKRKGNGKIRYRDYDQLIARRAVCILGFGPRFGLYPNRAKIRKHDPSPTLGV